jgi:maleamate amidohydrolase
MNKHDIYQKQGFGKFLGIGNHSVLLLIDFVNGFVDPDILGSKSIESAAFRSRILLDFFRLAKLPVVHTRVVFDDHGANYNLFSSKVTALQQLTELAEPAQIVPILSPLPGEHVIKKQSASAFFSTGLAEWLSFRSVDTIFIVGCTTSGCIRASVVDAMQYNFKTIVVSDCVADRAIGPHEANLFDMGQKYADLMTLEEVLQRLKQQHEL